MTSFFLSLPQACILFLTADILTNTLVINRLLTNYSRNRRFILFLKETLFSLGAMILLFWSAKGVIHILHTPPCALQSVGGIVVVLIGIRATLHLTKEDSWQSYPEKPTPSFPAPFITPITIPLMIGPSWLAACCAFIGKQFTDMISMLTLVLSWVLIAGTTFVLHILINPKNKKTLLAIQTVLGLFVVIIGTQLLVSGLQSTFL
ncbi:MarC family protein [Chlamydia sp. 17-3921]|uniref:MarC family protein n=1 Tax=Chlamydia sp. 17-3921 TaxID=2675798 RepID=UPI0019184EA8|nr:MarC family protein [Chlamydia sp. 17-3921]